MTSTADEKAALRKWAVEKSVELFAHNDDFTTFKILAYSDLFRVYVETGERPR